MAIAGVYLHADELEALYSLPHLAIALYVIAMRPRADFKRCTLGVEPAISWHALTEWVYQEPTGGVVRGPVTIKQVRNACDWLIRAGLVELRTSERRLIFFFPKMRASSLVQNKPGRNRADQPGRPVQREEGAKPGRPEDAKPGKHPGNEEACLTTSSPVHTLEGSSPDPDGSAGIAAAIQWPARWPAELRRALAAQLVQCPRGTEYFLPQAVIDELDGAQQKTDVRNPHAYARRLVEAARAGRFVPEWGIAVAAQRQQRASLQERGGATLPQQEPPRPLTEAERDRMRRMLPKLKRLHQEANP